MQLHSLHFLPSDRLSLNQSNPLLSELLCGFNFNYCDVDAPQFSYQRSLFSIARLTILCAKL